MKPTQTNTTPNYLNPDIAPGLNLLDIPIVEATAENLKGYGYFGKEFNCVSI